MVLHKLTPTFICVTF